MSKKPVSYIKPQDPSFLVKLKKEAGYIEGPTVDTKREQPHFDSGSDDDINEEKPVVVVLKEGDLTEEEAVIAKNNLDAEKETVKADLSQKVFFQKPTNPKRSAKEGDCKQSKKLKVQKQDVKKQLLSFGDDEEEEN